MSTNKINDGGAAFPMIGIESDPVDRENPQLGMRVYSYENEKGMTLRDYFAAKAMAAMIGAYRKTWRGKENARCESETDTTCFDRDMATDQGDGCDEIAVDAYWFADAMLEEREKTGDEQ